MEVRVIIMTGEEFVKLCFNEKESILKEYFSVSSRTEVAGRINLLIESGTDRNELYRLIDLVLSENYYSLLLALDGEASLDGKQECYKLFDENHNLLNECGELEEAAFSFFMEDTYNSIKRKR